MKILVYGYGWIGKQFIKYFNKNNITFMAGQSRVDNTNDLIKEIDSIKPTHVLSLIGRTNGKIDDKEYTTIDYLEQKGKIYENVRDNLFAPLTVAILCKERNIHFTYLGTGCIFESIYDDQITTTADTFNEESEPNFFGSAYSVVKGFTDRLMHMYGDNTLNLRIRMPINGDVHSRNFITKITTYEKICSIPNSMSVLSELIPLAIDMMKNMQVGTINLTNPGLISHNEILEMYKEIVDVNFTWKNFTLEEQAKILAAGRSNNFLDTTKLQSLYPGVKCIKDSVRECLRKYRKNMILLNKLQESEDKTNADNFLTNKKDQCVMLVTGGSGFIGSNFINYIGNTYPHIKIINFDAMYYCASTNNIDENIRNSSNYIFVKGNLCSGDLVQYVLDTYKCTHVVHFAAQSHVQDSFTDPLKFINDNVNGTSILLESCRKYGLIKKFIYISTDEVYGESEFTEGEKGKTENSPLYPTNPYAATKAGAELLARSYFCSYGMPIIITRGNNVYGPNQYPEKLIPKFISLLNDNKKVTIQGDGTAVRSFLHSSDTVSAIECILLNGKIGEIYNIGGDDDMEYSVMDIAKMLIGMIKKEEENYDNWIEYIEDRPYNDKRYYISNEKLKKLGWVVSVSLADGLKSLLS